MQSIAQTKTTVKVLSRFFDNLPPLARHTYDPRRGTQLDGKDTASQSFYIQPYHRIQAYLCFDIDHDYATWYETDTPRPTIETITPSTGTRHYLYELNTPVLHFRRARKDIIAWTKDITKGLTRRLDADPRFTGHLTKNPLSEKWTVKTANLKYELSELAELTTSGNQITQKEIDTEYATHGRNCYLFERGRFFAYRIASAHGTEQSLYRAILEELNRANDEQFTADPLPYKELETTARSIAKWTFPRRFEFAIRNRTVDKADLKARQSRNAKETNQKRKDKTQARIHKAIAELTEQGKRITKSAVARQAGLNRKTVTESEILDR